MPQRETKPLIPDDAEPAQGCSIVCDLDTGDVALCFLNEDGKIFAYAMLNAGVALRQLGDIQIAVMEVVHGVQTHGQVGHA